MPRADHHRQALIALHERREHALGLAPRCAPVLSHLSDPVANPLNMVCYVFWDASPLLVWRGDPEQTALDDAVLDVLEAALALDNPACRESALHGIGHARQLDTANARPERIARAFLATNPTPPALRAYADAAATGCVQ